MSPLQRLLTTTTTTDTRCTAAGGFFEVGTVHGTASAGCDAMRCKALDSFVGRVLSGED